MTDETINIVISRNQLVNILESIGSECSWEDFKEGILMALGFNVSFSCDTHLTEERIRYVIKKYGIDDREQRIHSAFCSAFGLYKPL